MSSSGHGAPIRAQSQLAPVTLRPGQGLGIQPLQNLGSQNVFYSQDYPDLPSVTTALATCKEQVGTAQLPRGQLDPPSRPRPHSHFTH